MKQTYKVKQKSSVSYMAGQVTCDRLILLQKTMINSEHNTKTKWYLKAVESEQKQTHVGSKMQLGRRSQQEATFLFLKF